MTETVEPSSVWNFLITLSSDCLDLEACLELGSWFLELVRTGLVQGLYIYRFASIVST